MHSFIRAPQWVTQKYTMTRLAMTDAMNVKCQMLNVQCTLKLNIGELSKLRVVKAPAQVVCHMEL